MGLAGTSIVVNVVTLVLLGSLAMRLFFRPHLELDSGLQRHALRESFPLMLNNLLATLFFKVDVTLLEPLRGPREVGWYSTGYKFLDSQLNGLRKAERISWNVVLQRFLHRIDQGLLG